MVLQYLMGKILLKCMNLFYKCANFPQSITILYLACNQSKLMYCFFCKHPRDNRVCEKINKKHITFPSFCAPKSLLDCEYEMMITHKK